jgi:predicted HicB family RNase H-like nuclease
MRRRAARQGQSVNRFIVEMVEKNTWGHVSGTPR